MSWTLPGSLGTKTILLRPFLCPTLDEEAWCSWDSEQPSWGYKEIWAWDKAEMAGNWVLGDPVEPLDQTWLRPTLPWAPRDFPTVQTSLDFLFLMTKSIL